MALVIAHTTLMLPEALVIDSLLRAHGIRTASVGGDIVSTCPHYAVLFGGIRILVEEDQLAAARQLIAYAEPVDNYEDFQSAGFMRNPLRNGVLITISTFLFGVPLPFWVRGWRGR